MTKLSELIERFGGECSPALHSLDPDVAGVELDSRRVVAGSLFVGLPGQNADGARFLPDAFERGAAAVLVSTAPLQSTPHAADAAPVWVHPRAREVAGLVASLVHGEPTKAMQVVGITGTNGKTSVAHTLTELLELGGRRAGLIGTVAYRLADGRQRPSTHTTPDAPVLQRLLAEHRSLGGDAVVLEASSHALDQERLAGTSLDVAVFTNLSRDHLDYHADMDSYAAAKERLFHMLEAGGTAIVKVGDPASERMAAAARAAGAEVLTYGIDPGADLRVLDLDLDRSSTRVTLEGLGIERTELRIGLLGRHNVENSLAALAAALVSGTDPAAALDGLARTAPAPGRLEELTNADAQVSVIVDYAHSAGALREVLGALREVLSGARGQGGRLVCVFGCGGGRDRGKRAPMGHVVGELADVAVLTSDNPRNEDPEQIIADVLIGLENARASAVVSRVAEIHVETERRRAIEQGMALARPGDIVLVAGKGHEATQEIAGVKHPFDDRAIVRGIALCRGPQHV